MVRDAVISDIDSIYKLGEELNPKYRQLYDIEAILKEEVSKIIVYEENKQVLGFIHVTKIFETMDIVNIVVDKKWRNKGIGTLILDYVISEYDDLEFITLEVNVNNKAAITLYKKFGFEVVNVRKHYYNGEDAYLMKRCM